MADKGNRKLFSQHYVNSFIENSATLRCPYTYESGSRVRLGELDSGARLGYISPHTHEWIPKLCSYISVSKMSSSKLILDECGVFGRKRKNRKRREMWAKKWLLGRDRFRHLNLLNVIRNDSPEDYKNYLRMSDENVQYLIAKVKPLIAKQDTLMRNAITPEARILLSDKTRTVCVCDRVDTRVWLGTSHTRKSQ